MSVHAYADGVYTFLKWCKYQNLLRAILWPFFISESILYLFLQLDICAVKCLYCMNRVSVFGIFID